MTTTWFSGAAPMGLPGPGTPEEADAARLSCARLVRRAWAAQTLPLSCPPVPPHEVGPNRPTPVPDREALPIQAQWQAYLYDYLGLWPAAQQEPRRASVGDCGPLPPAKSRRYGQ